MNKLDRVREKIRFGIELCWQVDRKTETSKSWSIIDELQEVMRDLSTNELNACMVDPNEKIRNAAKQEYNKRKYDLP